MRDPVASAGYLDWDVASELDHVAPRRLQQVAGPLGQVNFHRWERGTALEKHALTKQSGL